MFLDAEGGLLAESGSEPGANIGFPTTPEELDAYCNIIRTACPDLSDDEVALLRAKLEALGLPDATMP
jgi:hypothetical protein